MKSTNSTRMSVCLSVCITVRLSLSPRHLLNDQPSSSHPSCLTSRSFNANLVYLCWHFIKLHFSCQSLAIGAVTHFTLFSQLTINHPQFIGSLGCLPKAVFLPCDPDFLVIADQEPHSLPWHWKPGLRDCRFLSMAGSTIHDFGAAGRPFSGHYTDCGAERTRCLLLKINSFW